MGPAAEEAHEIWDKWVRFDIMTRLLVTPLEPVDDHEIRAAISGIPEAAPIEIYIRANVPLVQDDATPWLPAETPVGMWLEQSVHIDGKVDETAMSNMDKAQTRLSGWYSNMTPISATAADTAPALPSASGVGCFFSGGVDSFYSVQQHHDRITHLIFAHGFDIPIDQTDLGGLARREARKAAAALGRPLIEVSTNIRAVSNGRVEWGTHYHGAAMAAVGLALAGHLSELIVPGSYAEGDLHPWGTHPELDPHWSSSRVRFVHDAIDVTRPEKVAALIDDDAAMDHLRVCFINPDGEYNCGRCEKCLRTMINLQTAGGLERCRTLPNRIDPAEVRRLSLSDGADLFVTENLASMRQLPDAQRDRDLERALRIAQFKGRIRRPIRGAARVTRDRLLRRRTIRT